MRRLAMLLAFVLLLGAGIAVRAEDAPPPSPTATTPAEAELGANVAKQLEKDIALVNDEAMLARLNTMAAKLAPFTQRPDVVYTCKILDTPALNAMVIPGGTIYFTKGLLLAVESDHELAGVMAHEIAHNSLYHAKKMMEREARIGFAQILTLIVSIYASRDDRINTGAILTMSDLLKQALLNGYSVELEIEADQNALEYLAKSRLYDPVGLYSVILGFHRMESSHAQVELGYLKTHPYTDERLELARRKLQALGIPINLWNVVNFRAAVVPPAEAATVSTLRLGDSEIVALTAADGEKSAQQRAEEAATAINESLTTEYVQPIDIDLDLYRGNAYVRISRIPVLTLVPADVEGTEMTLEALGRRTMQQLKYAIWREMIRRGW